MQGIHMQKMLRPCPGSVKDAVVSQIRHILSQPQLLPVLLCPEAAQPHRSCPAARATASNTGLDGGTDRWMDGWMSADHGFPLSSFTLNRKGKINTKTHQGRQQSRTWLVPSIFFSQLLLVSSRKEVKVQQSSPLVEKWGAWASQAQQWAK